MRFTNQTTNDSPELAVSQARGVASARPVLYIALVTAVICAAFLYDLRTNGIFACSAEGYSTDSYLAYCNSLAYGDYDHGAFWFDYEPEARPLVAAAEVLFLGSSRMQFAFSTAATEGWFARHGLGYYLFGFAYTENITFVAPLLASISPRARAYIINADGFFDDRVTAPVAEIFNGDGVESRYRRKRLWQYPHRPICAGLPALCGNSLSFFRARDNGSWTFHGADGLVKGAIADAPVGDRKVVDRRAVMAESFVASLHVPRRCVFLTVAPWAETPREEAAAIAEALGVRLLAPRMEELRTFDGSHLDEPSAELWSRQFFEVAGPKILSCFREPGAASWADQGSIAAPAASGPP